MHKYKGAIIAHIGPMFGGKTSALLADIRKMNIAKYNVELFKPEKDNRYADNSVVNHDGEKSEAKNINSFLDIVRFVESNSEINVIAIDEVQFIKVSSDVNTYFDANDFVNWIIENDKTLIVSGLDLDSELNPFQNTKDILPFATHIFKHKAVCVCCGADATTSYCKIEKHTKELIGSKEIYEPRCLKCYKKK